MMICRQKGYTLAEMLLVLVIMSIMMLCLPPLTRKMLTVNTVHAKHGRVECYYNKDDKLVMFKSIQGEGEVLEEVDPSVGCVFTPSSNAVYTMVHAVGGGGAGYSLSGNMPDVKYEHARSYLSSAAEPLWPDWYKYIRRHLKSTKLDEKFIYGNSFEVKKNFKSQRIPYGMSGAAGERISMFFPKLRKVQIIMNPGKGGALTDAAGGDGSDTVVKFRFADDEDATEVIRAMGGIGGKLQSDYSVSLTGGNPTDYGIGSLKVVNFQSSEFDDVLESTLTEIPTRINVTSGLADMSQAWGGNKAGWGGNGAYFYVNGDDSGEFVYQINNYTETVDSRGLAIKRDHWWNVTEYIPVSFYRKDGAEASCVKTDDYIEYDSYCTTTDGNQYDCEFSLRDNKKTGKNQVAANHFFGTASKDISQRQTNKTYNPYYSANNNYYNKFTTEPPAYLGALFIRSGYCLFDVRNDIGTCLSASKEKNGKHVCAYDKTKAFTCPNGIEQSGSICKSNPGGNGAVVILW